jgi:hypothetical protein
VLAALGGGAEESELLPLITVAKELRLDSEHAQLYWSTGHAMESARLDGKNRTVYFRAQLFSGKQGATPLASLLQTMHPQIIIPGRLV